MHSCNNLFVDFKISIIKNACKFFFLLGLIPQISFADSYNFNSYNNHGVVGLINMPSARFYNEGVHGITLYDGTPPQKITLTSNPYDWLEASFFYSNIQDLPYPGFEFQDYKDKGFNFKLRLKQEGILPAIAIGINDIAGTGYFSSEYIVGSYGIDNIDFHFGLGWGNLNGSNKRFKNPFGYIDDSFYERPSNFEDEGQGGQFKASRYFSDKDVSPFYGFTYIINNKTLIKFEKDTTLTNNKIPYAVPKNDHSFGIEYSVNDNFVLGLSFERGNYSSLKFIYKNNPISSSPRYKYEPAETKNDDNKYTKLIKNLEQNGVGVNKIIEKGNSIGLELTQFMHPNIQIVEEIIASAAIDSGLDKDIKKEMRVADLVAISEIDDDFKKESQIIYDRKKTKNFNTTTQLKFRPFLASREEFFKGALLLENDSEYIIRDNLFFNLNLKYSIADNFDDFRYEPDTIFPAQVRSDIKDYLGNMNNGVLIGRAQLDYHYTPKNNHHLMLSGGILEDMFSGYGFEYLYFQPKTNYAVGFELFNVEKRDYDWRLGTLDYQNVTGFINFYYRNYGLVPFDLKISYGEYLAGDIGSTFELSRSFQNGVKFGFFASNTDVTADQFGEGSFDKGIFFDIPIYGNFINYTWRPLTKDPGAKLIRKHSLHDLLVKFKPIY